MAAVKIPAAAADRAKTPKHQCHIKFNHLFSFAFKSIFTLMFRSAPDRWRRRAFLFASGRRQV
ncbi:MAG: hypothetical protein VW989_13355, partial [Rhodobiaceae bacterium]